MPNADDAIVKTVRGALEHDTRINLHRQPIRVSLVEGAIVLEGEVADVAAKKLALEHAGAVAGIKGVVDRLRVIPDEHKGDGAIRDWLIGLLERQPELPTCALEAVAKGRVQVVRRPDGAPGGQIQLSVEDGVITLEGSVISLSHKRIAGVLAWWTPGRRDVINSLDVQPPEEDNESEILDALRLVLEMDALVEAERIHASCRGFVVTLTGYVRTEAEKRRAELDAWYLFAVDRVVNELVVSG